MIERIARFGSDVDFRMRTHLVVVVQVALEEAGEGVGPQLRHHITLDVNEHVHREIVLSHIQYN